MYIKDEFRFKVIQWLIGTICLGVVTQIITCNHKNSEIQIEKEKTEAQIKIEQQKADINSLNIVLDHFQKDTTPERQLKVIYLLKTLSSFEDNRNRYEQLYNSLSHDKEIQDSLNQQMTITYAEQNKKLQDLQELLQQRSSVKETDSITIKKNENEKRALIQQIQIHEKQLKDYQKKQDELELKLGNVSKLTSQPAVSLVKENDTLTPSKTNPSAFINGMITETNWIKTGYYRDNDYLRLGVTNIDDNNKTVDFILTDKKSGDAYNFSVNESQSVSKATNNFLINLTLINITRLKGKNPFKPAAYYTMEIYPLDK